MFTFNGPIGSICLTAWLKNQTDWYLHFSKIEILKEENKVFY
jgi:hypothetical protein